MVLEDSKVHQLAKATVDRFGGAAQSFTPINQIHREVRAMRQVASLYFRFHYRTSEVCSFRTDRSPRLNDRATATA